MTVSTTTNKVTYTGDGSTTALPITFPFFEETDIEVVERVIATGAESTKVRDTDYTVTLTDPSDLPTLGTVTPLDDVPVTVQWVIRRVLPKTQEIDYVENDPFPAETHEEGLDRAAMRIIDMQEQVDRAPKFPVSDPSSAIGDLPNSVSRAGKAATYDSDGKPTATSFADLSLDFDITISGGDAGLPVVANAGEDGLEFPASASAHRTAIGAAGLEDANFFEAMQKFNVGTAIDDDDVASGVLTLPEDGNYFSFTGTEAVTSIASVAGSGRPWVIIRFGSARTLTHHSSDLILPGAANILTASGDAALFVEYGNGTWRCVHFTKADGFPVLGGPRSVQVFTSSGTWTRPANVRRVLIEVIGGGGGGGGADAAGGGDASGGGGGGGGGWAKKLLDVTAISSSTITVGAGGAGGTGADAGDTGGTSSWADGTNTVSATGGAGGAFGDTNVSAAGGAGGAGANGDINGSGNGGASGFDATATGISGAGGGSLYGGGAPAVGGNTAGAAGQQPGGGGSGALEHGTSTARNGGAGGAGIVIVWEY